MYAMCIGREAEPVKTMGSFDASTYLIAAINKT